MSKATLATKQDISDLEEQVRVLRAALNDHAIKSHASVHQNVEGLAQVYEDVYTGIIGYYVLKLVLAEQILYTPCTIIIGDFPSEVPSENVVDGVVRPYFISEPTGGSFSAGTTVALSVEVNGSLPITLQWKKNGVDILGETEPNLVISSFQSSSVGDYTCTATNTAGSTTSSPATLSLA